MTVTPGSQQLAAAFAEIARELEAQDDLQQTWQRIVDLCPKTLAACEHASVSIVHGRSVRTEAASSDVPRRVDQIQYETGQGPCLDAIRDQEPYQCGDLARDERWPQFGPRALEATGLRSLLSFRLFVEDGTMGALNLYSAETDAFDEADREVGQIFAAHAAVAAAGARKREEADQLRAALESNRRIGAAVGILMAAHNCSEEEAFEVLRRASQHRNQKLRDVADLVIQAQRSNAQTLSL